MTTATSRLAPSFLPATGVLEMTYRCNHRCGFCSCPWFADGGGYVRRGELSVAEWQAAIDRLTRMGVCNLAFTGGEALLKEGLFDIVRHAARCTVEHIETRDGALVSEFKAPNLYLLSNGTAVTSATLEFCRDFGVQLSMSLPGLATLREHTGIGDPDVILGKFRAAKALGLKTVANVTVTKRNLPELYQTISAAFLAGAQQLLLNRFLPGGRGLEHRDWVLNAAEVRTMLDTAEEALTDAGRFGSVGTELPRCIFSPEKYKRLTVGTRCSAAQGFFVVGPAGFVRVCNHSPVDLVHVSEIESLKTHPYWRRFTQRDYLPQACGSCAQASDCDGGCREAAHVVGGAVDSPDPLLAECARCG
jgi:radical SAM protein with 4Fe4S-binding SPASM domain